MADSDDPFLPSSLPSRPRPGAGRRGTPEPTAPFQRGSANLADFEPIPPSARAFLGLGLNPLVQAASPLLLLMGQLRTATSAMDLASLRRYALEEVRRFEQAASANGIRNEIVLAARYVLCAGLDEAVLSTPSGAQSEWSQHPLLVALHREAWGGEKFFEMLDRISADPGASPRFAGAAIPDTRARLHRQVSDARPRPREAGGSAGEGLPHHPRAARWSDNRTCRCDGAASRISAIG